MRPKRFVYASRAFERIFKLDVFAGGELQRARWGMARKGWDAVLGWGRKPSARRAQRWARALGVPLLRMEDGFLRSFGTGERFPPLSLVFDAEGIYYDCTRASALETLLNSDADVLGANAATVARARAQLLREGLSKYNHAPALRQELLRPSDAARVLVVDQTEGDLSVSLGGADARVFRAMLAAALEENPGATIYVKTHPEAAAGRKGGYLTDVKDDARTVVLRKAVNPLSLMAHMDRVYVVTSTMGFEALLAGRAVTCFGMPWYAGWGVTDDRLSCGRRTRQRTVDELFAAAYVHYARYLDPVTHQRGTMFDVLDWLARQREVAERFAGRMICVGFARWRVANMRAMLSLHPGRVLFARDARAAALLGPQGDDCLVCWGRVPPDGVEALAQDCGVRLLRMEDGFARSVGLGSDLIPPQSFVLDETGIYFDPSQPSDLEWLLNERPFTDKDLQRAQAVRAFIVAHGITKYNMEPRGAADWPAQGRQVVLVPGQVEDDASIRFGCDPQGVCTNLGLLQAARQAFPGAFIVYKPHPDVVSRNRRGRLLAAQAGDWADWVETRLSVVSCIEACDVVVTMTSLTGFDALLRGKRVVVHGRPFYAGWGLTEDRLPVPRRHRRLSLDELVAGALLHYPLYWDPCLKGYTTCEAVLHRIVEERTALERQGRLESLRTGYLRRQMRKLAVLGRALMR